MLKIRNLYFHIAILYHFDTYEGSEARNFGIFCCQPVVCPFNKCAAAYNSYFGTLSSLSMPYVSTSPSHELS
jgi:hypothetical protein